MALLSPGFPTLTPDVVSLYYTKDPLLENLPFLVFYGSSTTSNATRSSTRVQAHVYSLAGFQSFPRLTISPTSPLYAAVNHLPLDKQGDEICRGLAVSLLSYFAGLSGPTKDVIKELAGRRRPNRMAPAMFDEMHAGELASNMVKADNGDGIIRQLSTAMIQQTLSWIDVDLVLPDGTIQRAVTQEGPDLVPAFGDDGLPLYHFDKYDLIIKHLGHPAFLPTSKLRRAPSRPTAHSRSRTLSKTQKIGLRREMCEILDTERSYVSKLQTLVNEIAVSFRQSYHADGQNRVLPLERNPINQLFPESLTRILIVNNDFLADIEDVLATTEDEAIQDIEGLAAEDLAEDLAKLEIGNVSITTRKRDPTGTLALAKVLLKWLPKFSSPYQDYMRVSADLPDALSAARDESTSTLCHTLDDFGEQRLRAMLIEPVQRLPRYSLLLDNIIGQLPASHPAMSSLLKSKDILADICALESGSSADSARISSILRKFIVNWPSWLSPRGRLITAIDAITIIPPYSNTSFGQNVILLLFPDTLILAQKSSGDALSAKGVLAEIDRSSMALYRDSIKDSGLQFCVAYDLSKLRLSESADGRTVRITHVVSGNSYLQPTHTTRTNASADVSVKVLLLQAPYEGKANQLSEDIAKARIEGRFSEPIRQSDKWTLRSTGLDPGGLGFLIALYEDNQTRKIDTIKTPCRARIGISSQNDLGSLVFKDSVTEVAAQVMPIGSDKVKLCVQGIEGGRYSETIATEAICHALVKNSESSVQRACPCSVDSQYGSHTYT